MATVEQILIQGGRSRVNANLSSEAIQESGAIQYPEGSPITGPVYEIQGYVFEDLNGDGLRNDGEPGLAEQTISLTGANGYNVTTLSDTNGFYKFKTVKKGVYQLVYPSYVSSRLNFR